MGILWIKTMVDDLKTFWKHGWLFCKKTSEMHFRPIFRRPPIRSMQPFFPSFIVPTFNELLMMEDIQIKYLAKTTQNISTQRDYATLRQYFPNRT